jgi:carbamoyl-phosphate synthase large subunit
MPKRNDIHSILIIGSGPIVIGQACEFDYAGTQACMALREEGYKVILINSNPATIMTDPQIADVTYIEPITKEFVLKIIEKEKPCAILPTMGGQTALNVTLELAKAGALKAHGVKLIGANAEAIELAEDRFLFKKAMEGIGLSLPKSGMAHSLEEAQQVCLEIGLPIVVRPSFILGGSGSGIAHTEEEFLALCKQAFLTAPNGEILLDEALIGWKEFEMEVVRDKSDNCMIVCCIENLDPLGIHTGDSITVAPSQTLTDKEYQKMRDASFEVLRTIGVETGGSNVQFAVHPKNGRMVVIEMNPRVSRSSALASKATGFPIAKVAAKLAVGYTLSELSSELTGNQIPASFEPTIDYVVVKIPRFNFEKFKGCNEALGTQMRSVGESMAIGRTFQEALCKAMRSMEVSNIPKSVSLQPGPFRLWAVFEAFRKGMSVEELHGLTDIDPWFLTQIEDLVEEEKKIAKSLLTKEELYEFKRFGFSDAQIGGILKLSEEEIRMKRKQLGIIPVYKRIDSCAAEFATSIAYLYSTYEEECEAKPTLLPKIMILGSGPCRIAQGIEFDYSCVHAIQAFKEEGYETIIVNCNPETISTDYDCADKLYFSPLTVEDILAIVDKENPVGVVLQYGGQTPLNLAAALTKAGVPLLGITLDLIEKTEDRSSFKQFLKDLNLKQPGNAIIHSLEEGIKAVEQIGYPLIVRPSFVLGGRAMAIVFQAGDFEKTLKEAFLAAPGKPVLLERFLVDATEVDVDAICDGQDVFIPGILEHVELAGIHSGDSACSLPPFSLDPKLQEKILEQTKKMALGLNLVGLLNIQFAIQEDCIYVLEVNPRASRTVPFTSKAMGIDLVKIASRCLLGISLKKQGYLKAPAYKHFAVKEAVLPFSKFENVDSLLGPEMKSTGEVLGLGMSFAEAYAKAQIASGYPLPKPGGGAVLSLEGISEDQAIQLVNDLLAYGMTLYTTPPTLHLLQAHSIPVSEASSELGEEIEFIIALGKQDFLLRRLATSRRICHATTISAAHHLVQAMQMDKEYSVIPINELTKQEALCQDI